MYKTTKNDKFIPPNPPPPRISYFFAVQACLHGTAFPAFTPVGRVIL